MAVSRAVFITNIGSLSKKKLEDFVRLNSEPNAKFNILLHDTDNSIGALLLFDEADDATVFLSRSRGNLFQVSTTSKQAKLKTELCQNVFIHVTAIFSPWITAIKDRLSNHLPKNCAFKNLTMKGTVDEISNFEIYLQKLPKILGLKTPGYDSCSIQHCFWMSGLTNHPLAKLKVDILSSNIGSVLDIYMEEQDRGAIILMKDDGNPERVKHLLRNLYKTQSIELSSCQKIFQSFIACGSPWLAVDINKTQRLVKKAKAESKDGNLEFQCDSLDIASDLQSLFVNEYICELKDATSLALDKPINSPEKMGGGGGGGGGGGAPAAASPDIDQSLVVNNVSANSYQNSNADTTDSNTNAKNCNKNANKETGKDEKSEKLFTVQMERDIVEYISKAQSRRLKTIESKHNVTIEKKDDMFVVMASKSGSKPPAMSNAKEEVEELLREVTQQMYPDNVIDATEIDVSVGTIKSVIDKVNSEEQFVYIKNDLNHFGIIVYGEKQHVKNAKAKIRRYCKDRVSDSKLLKAPSKVSTRKPSPTQKQSKNTSTSPSTSVGKNTSSYGSSSHKTMAHGSKPKQNTHDELQQLLKKKYYSVFTDEGIEVILKYGDITREKVGAIVNAANSTLEHGGGVAKAIARAGGTSIQTESWQWVKERGPLEVSGIAVTSAGHLPCHHVIHAYGPDKKVHGSGMVPEGLLHRTAINVLECANDELKVRSVAIPAISSGVYGMPREDCAGAMYRAVSDFSKEYSSRRRCIIERVVFVNIDDKTNASFITVFHHETMKKVHGDDKATDTSKDPSGAQKWSTVPSDVASSPAGMGDCDICCIKDISLTKMNCCGHPICRQCTSKHFTVSPKCPFCQAFVSDTRGDQPKGGRMDDWEERTSLVGFPGCGTIVIEYYIPDGVQTDNHPNPGKPYFGTNRKAYLPDNDEGREVLVLLRKAFSKGLIFTVGISATTGRDNSVVWNDVHHKTSRTGGETMYGYPDPTYLKRVKQELASKGIK
ncbi:uncharacterized protein LOC144437988 [Glandiceps talaboti]